MKVALSTSVRAISSDSKVKAIGGGTYRGPVKAVGGGLSRQTAAQPGSDPRKIALSSAVRAVTSNGSKVKAIGGGNYR